MYTCNGSPQGCERERFGQCRWHDAQEVQRFTCPICEVETDQLSEGYCRECCEERQMQLDRHNFECQRWASLTDAEREAEIRRA